MIEKETHDITFGDIIKIFQKFKYPIIVTTLLFTLVFGVFAYFKTNVYRVDMAILIEGKEKSSSDFIGQALSGAHSNIGNELEIIQSTTISRLVLNKVDIGTRYYTSSKYKTKELYKNSPFLVTTTTIKPKMYNKRFTLQPIDETSFELKIKPSIKAQLKYNLFLFLGLTNESKKPIEYTRVCQYGELISAPWFELTVQKIYELNDTPYYFSVIPNKYMSSFIRSSLSVNKQSDESDIVLLSFEDTVPSRATEILETLVNTYKEEALRQRTIGAKNSLEFLDTQLAAVRKELNRSAKNLQTYKSKNKIIDVETKAETTTQHLAELENTMEALNSKSGILQNLLVYINNNNDITKIDLVLAEEASPRVTTIITDMQEAIALKESLLVDYTELHPDVLKVSKKIEELKKQLVQSLKSISLNVERKKERLALTIDNETKALQVLPAQQQRLTQLTRNFVANEQIYTFLQQRRAETAILESSTVSGIRTLELPENSYRIKPKRVMIVITGFILGLVLSMVMALLKTFLNKTITSVEEIERNTSLQIYGVLPKLSDKAFENQRYEEAIRVLRTNLELLSTPKRSKLITITSSIASEGKSTTVYELASVIALAEKKVVVIDLDMRKAELSASYSVNNDFGISTLLAKKHTLKEVIQTTLTQNLDFIAVGPRPNNPSELMMSEDMMNAISTLMKSYDYVILDSPPIGLVTDAMMLMKKSDISLFVLKANFSKIEFIHNIDKFVKQYGLTQAGLIFNDVPIDKSSPHGYGYGYGYGNSS